MPILTGPFFQCDWSGRVEADDEACRFDHFQDLGVVGACAGEVVLVVQGRQRAGLGEGIDVERLTDFFERGDQLWMADAITEAEPGQAENLGERPHHQQVCL